MEFVSFICFVVALMELRREWPNLQEILSEHIQSDQDQAAEAGIQSMEQGAYPQYQGTVVDLSSVVLFPGEL